MVRSREEALDENDDGAVVGVGGSITAGHPMALVRELIRQGIRDLTVVAPTAGLDIDLLIAAGSVQKLVTSYVGAEGLAPTGPTFRAAVESGSIEVSELDEAHCAIGLRAAAQRLPFMPWRGGVGTSLPELNADLKEFKDPIRGETLLAIPAIRLDVALIYAETADSFGNLQTTGTSHMDPLLAAAADLVVVQADSVISNKRVREDPSGTQFWPRTVVVNAPWGTHPYSGTALIADEEHLRLYTRAAEAAVRGEPEELEEYLRRYVRAPRTHEDYLDEVGTERVTELQLQP